MVGPWNRYIQEKHDANRWREIISSLCESTEPTIQPFVSTYTDGQLFTCNSAFCDLVGHEKDSLANMGDISILIPPEGKEQEDKARERLSKSGKPQRYETWYRDSMGNLIRVLALLHGAADISGNIIFYYSFITKLPDNRPDGSLCNCSETLAIAQKIAHVGSWEMKMATGSIYGSEEACQIFGVRPEDIKTIEDAILKIHPEDRKAVYSKLEKVLSTGKPQRADYRIIKPDGSERFVHSESRVFYDDHGDPARLFGIVHDITEQKLVENALTESETKYRNLIENINDWIWEVNTDGVYTHISQKVYSVLGYMPEDLIGRCPVDIMEPGEAKRLENLIGKAFKERKPVKPIECVVRSKDGRNVFIEVSAVPIFDRQNNITGFRGTARDITDRKSIVEALRESEERFKSIFDHAACGICLCNVEGHTINANKTLQDILGCDLQELSGINLKALMHPEDAGKDDPFKCVIEGGSTSCRVEKQFIRKDGRTVHGDMTISVTKDLENNPEYIIVLLRDITNRKKAEKDLEDARAQTELYLDLMSHDISNIHQIALGYLEVAAKVLPIDEHQSQLISMPMESLKRSAHIVDLVRKLQKVKQGGIGFERVDIGKMLWDVCTEVNSDPRVNVNINYDLNVERGVYANVFLYDVFTNLVGNSIKHSNGKEVEISVSIDNVVNDDTPYYRIVLEDNGPGITDDMKSIVFNRTQRGATSVKGMGLGLYLVKTLVDSYSGRVWIEDRVHGEHAHGARFVIMLPVAGQMTVI